MRTLTGRELDAAVAARLGWRREGSGYHIKPRHRASQDYPGEILDDWDAKGPHDYLIPPDEEGYNQRVAFCGCASTIELPHYSTSLADAWGLVEHCKRTGGNLWDHFIIELRDLLCPDYDWKRGSMGFADLRELFEGLNAEAICKAFLSACRETDANSLEQSQTQ